jgi:hypothetical protein
VSNKRGLARFLPVLRGRLRAGGWTGADGTPSAQPRALNSVDGLSDPAFRAALMCAEFDQLPHLGPLRAAVRRILGRRRSVTR